MLKFYYSAAPNPTKIALFLEEAGLPFEAIPVDTRKGDQHKPEFLAINPNAKVPAIVDGDVTVFDSQRDPALSRREDRQVPAGQDRQGARRTAVLDVLRRRPASAPIPASRCTSATTRRRSFLTRSTATPSRRSATSASSMRASPSSKYMLGDTYTIVDMNVWGWARLMPNILGEGGWAKFPNLKRLVDEVNARPAAQKALDPEGPAQVQDRDGRRSARGDVPAPQREGGVALKPPARSQ